MTASTKHYSIWAASMVASLAAAFAAVGAVSAGRAGADRMHCEMIASAARDSAAYRAPLRTGVGGQAAQCAGRAGRAP